MNFSHRVKLMIWGRKNKNPWHQYSQNIVDELLGVFEGNVLDAEKKKFKIFFAENSFPAK